MLETILGAGLKLAGGFMGLSSQNRANEIAEANAARNIQLQEEFAKKGIRWRVADAKAAGIHPIYALGGSTTSFAPVSVGVSGANPLADSLASMGQDVTRSAAALRGSGDRASAVFTAQQAESNSLSLDNQRLRNQMLRIQLAKMQAPGTPPGIDVEVPDESKVEANPVIQAGPLGRIPEDRGFSPTKAVSDRWGDESFATNTYGNIRAVRDIARALGANPDSWRSGLLDSHLNAAALLRSLSDRVTRSGNPWWRSGKSWR